MIDIDALMEEWATRHAAMTRGESIPPHHDRCLGCGPQNPHGFHLTVYPDGDKVITTHAFDERHVGAPGIAHGGAVAAVLDDLYGFLLFRAGGPAVTRKLKVEYLSPALLGVTYTFEASILSLNGRKLRVSARVTRPDGPAIATSKALFIMVSPAHFRAATKPASETSSRSSNEPG